MSSLVNSFTPIPIQACRGDELVSWKEIASYLNRGLRTVQRWEKQERLPVHRHIHEKSGSIYGYKTELDAWLESRRGGPRRLQTRRMVLAVLPFDDLGGFADCSNIGDGLTEEIITQIASLRIEGLAVIARSSVQSYKNRKKGIDCIAAQLRAHWLLEGTISRKDGITRITVQLISADDGTISWAAKYESVEPKALLLQGKIALSVGRSVAAEVLSRAKSSLTDSVDVLGTRSYRKSGLAPLNELRSAFEKVSA
jgi:TolB-like protein